jgi:hypothetical protein
MNAAAPDSQLPMRVDKSQVIWAAAALVASVSRPAALFLLGVYQYPKNRAPKKRRFLFAIQQHRGCSLLSATTHIQLQHQ